MFTKKYEHEWKQILSLKEKLSNTLREKADLENEVHVEKFSQEKVKKEKIWIKTLENELEKEVTKYDSVLAKNQGTKREIDVMRKEINTA